MSSQDISFAFWEGISKISVWVVVSYVSSLYSSTSSAVKLSLASSSSLDNLLSFWSWSSSVKTYGNFFLLKLYCTKLFYPCVELFDSWLTWYAYVISSFWVKSRSSKNWMGRINISVIIITFFFTLLNGEGYSLMPPKQRRISSNSNLVNVNLTFSRFSDEILPMKSSKACVIEGD